MLFRLEDCMSTSVFRGSSHCCNYYCTQYSNFVGTTHEIIPCLESISIVIVNYKCFPELLDRWAKATVFISFNDSSNPALCSLLYPTGPFHNYRSSRWGDRRILCSLRTSSVKLKSCERFGRVDILNLVHSSSVPPDKPASFQQILADWRAIK